LFLKNFYYKDKFRIFIAVENDIRAIGNQRTNKCGSQLDKIRTFSIFSLLSKNIYLYGKDSTKK